MFKKIASLFCGVLLSVIVTQRCNASENNTIKPVKLERDIDILGLKIGDSLEEVRKNIKGKLGTKPTIREAVSPAGAITQISIDSENVLYPSSSLTIYLTDKYSGNLLYGLRYKHHQSSEKPIGFKNLLTDLHSKYGEESEYPAKRVDMSHYLFWVFNLSGKIQKIENPTTSNRESNCCMLTTEENFLSPRNDCKEKSLTLFGNIGKHGDFAESIELNMIDYDFYFSAQKAEQQKLQELHEKGTKKQLEQAKGNKISF